MCIIYSNKSINIRVKKKKKVSKVSKKVSKVYNLLQISFDHQTELFISGKMPMQLYFDIERLFIQRSKLFTICLN